MKKHLLASFTKVQLRHFFSDHMLRHSSNGEKHFHIAVWLKFLQKEHHPISLWFELETENDTLTLLIDSCTRSGSQELMLSGSISLSIDSVPQAARLVIHDLPEDVLFSLDELQFLPTTAHNAELLKHSNS